MFLPKPFPKIKVGYKTILHLAIDEDDHDTTDYIDVLLKVLCYSHFCIEQQFLCNISDARDCKYISCSVFKSEWHSSYSLLILTLYRN